MLVITKRSWWLGLIFFRARRLQHGWLNIFASTVPCSTRRLGASLNVCTRVFQDLLFRERSVFLHSSKWRGGDRNSCHNRSVRTRVIVCVEMGPSTRYRPVSNRRAKRYGVAG